MGRAVMDSGFRRIKAGALTTPTEDSRLVLVEQFAAAQQAEAPEPDTREPAEQPEPEAEGAGAQTEPEAAQKEQAMPEEDVEPAPPADDKDYDPIAAVLG